MEEAVARGATSRSAIGAMQQIIVQGRQSMQRKLEEDRRRMEGEMREELRVMEANMQAEKAKIQV